MAGAFSYGMTPSNSPKGSAFQAVQTAVFPAGIVQIFAGVVAPNGWLVCDGSAVSRKTYSDLFKTIGTNWGAGNSNDTFNLPDMRGRCPIGVGVGAGLTARTLAATAGNETVALSTSELASHNHTASDSGHTHTGTTGNMSADHTHTIGPFGTSGGQYGVQDTGNAGSSGTPATSGASANHTHAFTTNSGSSSISVGSSGSGSAHNNMQPSIAINFIIKT